MTTPTSPVGFVNGVAAAWNADFSGSQSAALANGLITDNQIWLGSTALNAGLSHINVVTLTAGAGVTLTNAATTLTIGLAGGGAAVEHLTGNTGGLLNPTANNFNILGPNSALTGFSPWVTGSGSTLTVNMPGTVKWVVNTTSGLGTHTTLAGAMAAASAGDTILLATSVTENVTITPGVNIVAYDSNPLNTPSITGKLTMTGAGTSLISGVELITNSDFFLAVTGVAASIIYLKECYLNCLNNTGISYTSSSASSGVFAFSCVGNLGTTGIGLYAASATGGLDFEYCRITNSGSSLTASNNSSSAVSIQFSNFLIAISTSSTGTVSFLDSNIDTSAINTTCFTSAGSGTNVLRESHFASGTASALSIGVGTTMPFNSGVVNSTNTNAITGAGTFKIGSITFNGTSSLINTTTQSTTITQKGGYKIVLPAGDYTVLASDEIVGATSSAARAITLNASPAAGQVVTIKDITGTAGTNNITITPAAGNIDGAGTTVINVNYGSVTLFYSGTAWFII